MNAIFTPSHSKYLLNVSSRYKHFIGFIKEPSVLDDSRCFLYAIYSTAEDAKEMDMIASGGKDEIMTEMEPMRIYTMEDLK